MLEMLKFQHYLVFGGLGFGGGEKGMVKKVEISIVLRGEEMGNFGQMRVGVLVACPVFRLKSI